VVRCGPLNPDGYARDPVFLAEVLSPSTMTNDRGRKVDFYKSIPSLGAFAVIYADEARVEAWRRDGEGWAFQVLKGLAPPWISPTLRRGSRSPTSTATFPWTTDPLPHFDPFYADKLRGPLGAAEADAVLDLSGRSAAEAEAAIREMLERSRFAQRSTLAVKLSPPARGRGRDPVPARGAAIARRAQARLDRAPPHPAGPRRLRLLRGARRASERGLRARLP
jgi:hypothetical protein